MVLLSGPGTSSRSVHVEQVAITSGIQFSFFLSSSFFLRFLDAAASQELGMSVTDWLTDSVRQKDTNMEIYQPPDHFEPFLTLPKPTKLWPNPYQTFTKPLPNRKPYQTQ